MKGADQASGLRNLFARRRPEIVIVCGCASTRPDVAVQLAQAAAAEGRETLLVDASVGEVAGRLSARLPVPCRYELNHVVTGDKALCDVLRTIRPRLTLLPAARALARFGMYDADETARLYAAFARDLADVESVVVHATAADAASVASAFGRDARIVVAAADDAESLRDSYRELKALARHVGFTRFEIVTMVATPSRVRKLSIDANPPPDRAFANLAATARRFLDPDIELVDGGSVAGVGKPAASASIASRPVQRTAEKAPPRERIMPRAMRSPDHHLSEIARVANA